MSSTAQKQDISDPEVVRAFAAKVGTDERLTLLYILTVADIRGTSPKVWNAWKAQLLEDLFHATRRVLAGADAAATLGDSLQQRQDEAARLLRLYAVPDNAERALWRHLDTPYFQRHTAEEIAWHARNLYWRVDRPQPVVKARPRAHRRRPAGARLPARPQGAVRAPVRLLRPRGTVDRRREGPHDRARLRARHVRGAGHRRRIRELARDDRAHRARPLRAARLGRAARAADVGPRRRQLRHFPAHAGDPPVPRRQGHALHPRGRRRRPAGLLARIAYVLANANVNVASAKINTLGERAEDVFLVDGARLHDEQALLRLETALYEQLHV
jgi:[protein-PII] uridylyltransferase